MKRTFGFVIPLFLIGALLFSCSEDTQKEVNEKLEIANKTDSKRQRSNETTSRSDDSPEKYAFIYNDSVSEYINAYNKTLALFELPIQEKDIQTQFGNAHVLTCGKTGNPPLVLLHGMNASSTMWYPNMKSLAETYRVYAIDFLLEPGKSTAHSKSLKTEEITSWYDEIFSKLGLDSFYLVGCSKGGWLAMAITLNKPQKVKKLALLSPAQTFTWIPPSSALLSNITYSISPDKEKLSQILAGLSVRSVKISKPYLEQYYLGIKNERISSDIFAMTPYSRKSVEDLKMPLLVLIGDKDIINNQRCLNKAKKWLPHAQTATIKNAGHFLSFDQPQEVNVRIRDFLSK